MSDTATIDHFDRLLGALHGLPDVVSTRQATVRSLTPLVGTSETFIVQTYRQQTDKGGATRSSSSTSAATAHCGSCCPAGSPT